MQNCSPFRSANIHLPSWGRGTAAFAVVDEVFPFPFPLGKNGRFVNRPYGTHPRLALQYFTPHSAAFHKIIDFISRCRGQHFTAHLMRYRPYKNYHAAGADPFVLCKPLFAFTPIVSQNPHNVTAFLRSFLRRCSLPRHKKRALPCPDLRGTRMPFYILLKPSKF